MVFAYTVVEAEILQIAEDNGGNLKTTIYNKYGFDSSGSHLRAMQPDSMGDLPECKTLNASQMVPLRLVAMVDGKVVSGLTNTNTTCCTICDKSGPEMAKNEEASPLHFGLCVFEALLHICYKQDFKAFRAKKEAKQTAAVKEAFKRELGLLVDQRQEGGFGTTNTGNVVRKAFANAEKTAPICGVSTMQVSNLDVICRTFALGQDIHPQKIDVFCP